MRVEYLKFADWEPDWIETANEIAEDCWKAHYKRSDSSSDTESPRVSQFAYSVSTPLYEDQLALIILTSPILIKCTCLWMEVTTLQCVLFGNL